jgi:hypothetical protein
MSKCTICNREITSEDPRILTMGAYGTPKYLCDECSSDIDEVSCGRDYDKIAATMEKIGNLLANSNPDKTTFETVNSIMEEAAERAKLIKSGEYDFSLDEYKSDGEETFEDVPEELKETEEDRELDREDEEKLKKFDKFFNWVLVGAGIGLVGFIIWRIIDAFVLK